MLQELRELSLKEHKANSLKGLMETVVAGEGVGGSRWRRWWQVKGFGGDRQEWGEGR